jgi:hypothetical protein
MPDRAAAAPFGAVERIGAGPIAHHQAQTEAAIQAPRAHQQGAERGGSPGKDMGWSAAEPARASFCRRFAARTAAMCPSPSARASSPWGDQDPCHDRLRRDPVQPCRWRRPPKCWPPAGRFEQAGRSTAVEQAAAARFCCRPIQPSKGQLQRTVEIPREPSRSSLPLLNLSTMLKFCSPGNILLKPDCRCLLCCASEATSRAYSVSTMHSRRQELELFFNFLPERQK